MSKTVAISDDAHSVITKKQEEIYKKYRVKVRISDLVNVIVINNIDKAEELLGIGIE